LENTSVPETATCLNLSRVPRPSRGAPEGPRSMRLAAVGESHEAVGYDRLPKVMYGQSVKSGAKLEMSVCRAEH